MICRILILKMMRPCHNDLNGQGRVYTIHRKIMANYTNKVVMGGKEYFTLLYLNDGQGWKSSSEGKNYTSYEEVKFWKKESLHQSGIDGATVNIEGKSAGRHITELFTRNQAYCRKKLGWSNMDARKVVFDIKILFQIMHFHYE